MLEPRICPLYTCPLVKNYRIQDSWWLSHSTPFVTDIRKVQKILRNPHNFLKNPTITFIFEHVYCFNTFFSPCLHRVCSYVRLGHIFIPTVSSKISSLWQLRQYWTLLVVKECRKDIVFGFVLYRVSRSRLCTLWVSIVGNI